MADDRLWPGGVFGRQAVLWKGEEPSGPSPLWILFGVARLRRLLDTASLFLFPAEISWKALLALYASGFPFNLVHAVATVVFLWLLNAPVCTKLERLVRKYGIDTKAVPPRAREKAEKP